MDFSSWIPSSVSDLFSSDPEPAATSTTAPPPPSIYNPSEMISAHYSLANLIATSQQLSRPNLPTSALHYENLFYTADILERLENEIGPLRLLSGYRTKELQTALASAGEPVASGTSFHELGRGVDITPTTMPLAEYYGRILANEDLASQFAEIAIKASQNSLHLAINVPSDIRTPKVLGLNQEGIYARLTADDIAAYVAPFMESVEDAYDYAEAKLVTMNKTPLILAVAAAAAGLLYLTLAGGSKTRTNPRRSDTEKMIADYLKGMSAVKIGKKYKVSSSYIYHLLNEQKIERVQPQQYSHQWKKKKAKSKIRRKNPRVRVKQLNKHYSYSHLSDKALKKILERTKKYQTGKVSLDDRHKQTQYLVAATELQRRGKFP